MVESIGKRIAYLRQKHGWTQQSLAERLAMSRVAVSHIEMDLSIPSERSITLMAGVFKIPPGELVDGTTYPAGKAERLPEVTATFTNVEIMHALLFNDLEWLARLDGSSRQMDFLSTVLEKWMPLMERLDAGIHDGHEAVVVQNIRQALMELKDKAKHQRE